MSDHSPRTFERHCDVAVVGGSAAGLAAALQLGRQRRSVIVIDSGEPRNAPSAHMHGYLGFEGCAPADLIAKGREEVRSYGGEVLVGRVLDVARLDDGHFRVDLAGGHAVIARRVLAATGLVDDLPDIEGVAEHWGRDVIHCPFCHGFEVRDQRIVQIVTHSMAIHATGLFRQLSKQVTVVLHGGVDPLDPAVVAVQAAGVPIVSADVRRIVAGSDGRVTAVEFTNGEHMEVDAVAIGAPFHVRAEPFMSLGLTLATHPSGFGDFVRTDELGATEIPGLYAAGNIVDPSQQVIGAAANGSKVGAMICFSLANEDMRAATRPNPNEADWDRRYAGEQVFSGNPNGTLVHEVASLTPGRALDVGAGEGGDAIWLAQQGWQVTASDISQRGLDRIGAEAARQDLPITCHHADANARNPFEPAAFDLVSAQYASIPRTPDGRAVRNILSAVAPGGTLVVVSHDLEPVRTHVDTHNHTRAFDPEAYVRVDDFAAALASDPTWHIEAHTTRPRPHGSATAHLHHHDLILRARRNL